ncbi:MAG: hypothetical protein ACRDZ6_07905 [Acidimicrobiales bacterium]
MSEGERRRRRGDLGRQSLGSPRRACPPALSIGLGAGDLRVEDGVLDELRDRLGR